MYTPEVDLPPIIHYSNTAINGVVQLSSNITPSCPKPPSKLPTLHKSNLPK
jgi:hypothetical protein